MTIEPKNPKQSDEQFLIDALIPHRQGVIPETEKTANYSVFQAFDRIGAGISKILGWGDSVLSGRVGGLDAVREITSKVTGGSMTLGDFGRQHGETPNREENLNPLGIPETVVGIAQRLASAGISDVSADDLQADIDRMRLSVYQFLGRIREFLTTYSEQYRDTIEPSLEGGPSSHETLLRLLQGFRTIFDGPSVIDASVHRDVETQLFRIQTHLNSTVIQIDNAVQEGIGQSVQVALTSVRGSLSSLYQEAGLLIRTHSDVTAFSEFDVRDLDPSAGAFASASVPFDVLGWQSARERGRSNFLDDPTFRTFRKTYVQHALSSYPKIATDFGNKGESEREAVQRVNDQVPAFEGATGSIGSGDKAQEDKSIETVPAPDDVKGPVGPLDASRWETYRNTLGQRESNNDYSRVNSIGFSGRWQFGGPALADFGYVRPGTSTRSLRLDTVWTGKDGISTQQDFLSNKGKVQDRLLVAYTRRNYKTLLKMGVISTSSDPSVVAGYLAVAHLLGPGGARKLANGIDNADGYGTRGSSYYNMMKSAIASGVPSNETTQAVAAAGGTPEQQLAAFVGSSTLMDGAPITFPRGDSASPRYPYASVKTYEAGHFKEYDSTPGNERIQEKHRTGTGYEIDANGRMKQVVVTDMYTAVLGNDYIMVKGHVHIVAHGDVGINAGGNVNVNSGNDLNIVSAGNVNFDVAGDLRMNVKGSKFETVAGDSAESVDGFKKSGVGGDYQLESASVNMAARDTQFNVSAKTDVNVYGLGNAHLLGKAKVMVTSKGDTVVSSGATVGVSGSTVGMRSGGQLGVKAGSYVLDSGSVSLKSGSEIQVSPQVSHANWAEQAGKAGVAPPGPASVAKPADGTSSYTYVKDSEDNQRQQKIGEESFNKDFEKFNPLASGKTQGHGGGQPGSGWDGTGYKSGIVDV